MRISDWSSDVCSSDLDVLTFPQARHVRVVKVLAVGARRGPASEAQTLYEDLKPQTPESRLPAGTPDALAAARRDPGAGRPTKRSEEHTSELQSLMRISYAVFCLKKKKKEQTR